MNEQNRFTASLDAALAELRNQDRASLTPPSLLEDRLMARRRAPVSAPAIARVAAGRKRQYLGRYLSIAAAMLLAIGAGWLLGGGMTPKPLPVAEKSPVPKVLPKPTRREPVKRVDSASETQSMTNLQGKPKLPRRSTVAKAETPQENYSEFVAVPAAAYLPPVQDARLVRVTMGPQNLRALGFTVTPASQAGMVTADLVVAQDGLARAVRFVQ